MYVMFIVCVTTSGGHYVLSDRYLCPSVPLMIIVF